MPRNFFINPYNFVPLGEKPLIKPETDEVGHLWFDKDRKSGKIHYSLKFVTPFIIPGKQTPGTEEKEGDIKFYTYTKGDGKEYLAIPGSRLRGHILNLMRAINSSPVTQFYNHEIFTGKYYRGNVESKVNNAQKGFPNGSIVQGFSGSASDKEEGMKSRLWFEMVMGPQKSDVKIERKNLRILSSQPPKSHNFYLKGGDYDCPNSKIRGRKFYWHNPHWKEKMWDNEDTGKGEYGFENAFPDDNKKQWSQADVAIPDTKNRVEFKGTIRFFNLTNDELNLLKTALVGIGNLENTDSCLKQSGQSGWKKWCHKIGHARPFIGSAYIEITGIELLEFKEGYIPSLNGGKSEDEFGQLTAWQNDKITNSVPTYIKAL
ncbi:MAG: RAMP superfamily CRISPR-associated protein, partial [Candidatus Marinimicrobia bacterium]|nr:hypothetical protein [bacterium]MCG2716143.1 RAMP superfamily CRISPR-associated protein [Candidatus Neomarinimicrobiota bacterium]